MEIAHFKVNITGTAVDCVMAQYVNGDSQS